MQITHIYMDMRMYTNVYLWSQKHSLFVERVVQLTCDGNTLMMQNTVDFA
jgi:hypothetical protein